MVKTLVSLVVIGLLVFSISQGCSSSRTSVPSDSPNLTTKCEGTQTLELPTSQFRSSIEFPIATHFPASGCGSADPQKYNPSQPNHFTAVVTDDFAPSLEQVKAKLQALEKIAQSSIHFVNALDKVTDPSHAINVVNNVVVNQALFTFILPVGWTPNAKFPILLMAHSGDLSNNSGIYNQDLPRIMEYVAASTNHGAPMIGMMTNAGGRQSQGLSEAVLTSVADALDLAENKFGGDKRRVVATGYSRGGNSALLWATNPLARDYKIIGVFASSGAYKFGEILSRSFSLFASLGTDLAAIFEVPNAFYFGNSPGPLELKNFAL